MTGATASSIEWFRNAKFGLFMHYGLYSLLGRGEWVQWVENIPLAEYDKLLPQFTAENFDLDFITDLACEAEMKYVNLTTMHHDGFCLFETAQTDFNITRTAAKRDLVADLAEQCHAKDLGLCFYYSHGRQWRHPHAMSPPTYDESCRPKYPVPEPSYATGNEHDISKYVAHCEAQVTELLTNYGPVANMWFDGWGTPKSGPWEAELAIPELYETIHRLQPDCLISYKFGLTGTEDFYAPEYGWPEHMPEEMVAGRESDKPLEVCHHIAGWGLVTEYDGQHRGPDSIMENLDYAAGHNANLLLNTGPLGDGSIDAQDVATLREVGKRLRRNG